MLPPPNTRSHLAKDIPQPASPNNSGANPHFTRRSHILSRFSQVKITHVSAHSLGSHCLFIPMPGCYTLTGSTITVGWALVSSHGLRAVSLSTPTIVTSLVENGGKAFTCAAGVTHVLVNCPCGKHNIRKYNDRRRSPDDNKNYAEQICCIIFTV